MEGGTALWAIGTALPGQRLCQQGVLDYMARGADRALQRRLRYIYRRSHIDFRYSCCPDFDDSGEALLCDNPSTSTRLRHYERAAPALGLAAARAAFAGQSRYVPADVSHVLLVSCTGGSAPGPLHGIGAGLGLGHSVRTLQIGFMGCQAALYGLQAADAICRSQKGAVVLLLCVELCSLHFRPSAQDADLVINSLFADGAAGVLLSGEGGGICSLGAFSSLLLPEKAEMLTWRIGDRGFEMGLDPALPQVLAAALPGFVEENGLGQAEPWAVHPGGRGILDAVERALALGEGAMEPSRAVLRQYGNMSSPTVLFVLKNLLEAGAKRGNILAFGPGLSLEAARWWQG